MGFQDRNEDQLDDSGQYSWRNYWELALRRRWWIIAPAFLCWAAALVAGFYLTPKYTSETVILLEQPKVPSQYVVPNVTMDLQNRLNSLTEQILSPQRLVSLIHEFHLYSGNGDEDLLVRRMKKDIEVALVKGVTANDLSSFKISYSGSEPRITREVTERLAAFFLEENLHNQRRSEDTTQFLEAQVEDARRELETQEERMRQFRMHNLGALPEQLASNMQILGGLQGRLDKANEALSQAEQQNLFLTSSLSQARSSQKDSDLSTTALVKQLDRLKDELAAANSRYTDRHPTVLRLKEQIAQAERLKNTTAPIGKRASGIDQSDGEAMTRAATPGELQIESQLEANKFEIASRKKEIKDLEHQINQYQDRLNLTPIREQEMVAITRNYNQSRTNYEALLGKKMQSRMATDLEKEQQGEQFRILVPANLPLKPDSPKRPKLAMLGLFAGVVLGVAASVFKESADARIHTDRDLSEFPWVRVLATVPPVYTPQEVQLRAHRQRVEVVLAAVILVSIPVFTALIYFRP
jgi:polysaccharide chain length determinant protein (PEP-CTERM system associated)